MQSNFTMTKNQKESFGQTSSVKSKVRETYVGNFRKITEHDLLYKHLNRMKLVPSPLCIFCQIQEQTSKQTVLD